MRDAVAIIQPAFDIDQASRDVARVHIAFQDGERVLEAAERKTESVREGQARKRLDLGRALITAKNGIKHGGWLPFLEKQGISDQSARNWMALAGHVEEIKSKPNSDGLDLPIPTRREVEAARHDSPSSTAGDQRSAWRAEEAESAAPSLDIERELSRIHNKICTFAEAVPADTRQRIAHQLRETARLIEGMR